MVQIRKTSNVIPFGRVSQKSSVTSSQEILPPSPFASRPVDALKEITGRKSRPLTEEQKLAILQKALKPFSQEASHHLPKDLSEAERKVHKLMITEGFSEVVAQEAGEETVDVLLERRVKRKSSSKSS